MAVNLFGKVREDAGMTQDELAKASGTSRTALSAYEHGRKSPRLDTAERIIAAAGRRLTLADEVAFVARDLGRGRTTMVPVNLPRLAPERAFATIELPVHLNWSQPGRVFRLTDRSDRARVYELVLTEGSPRTSPRMSTGRCSWTCGTTWSCPGRCVAHGRP